MRSFATMTYFPTILESKLMYTWMKKALSVLVLTMLATSQPVLAQTVPVEVSTTMLPAPITELAVAEPEIVVAPVVIQPTVQEVLLNVCQANGYGKDCAKTLLGMLWNESSNRYNVIGDNGKARGYFQIHYKLHKITSACAEDLVCSAQWTINYLERNSYPRAVSYAIQCHNSCNVNNGYAAKAIRNGNNFWNKPLAVNQAAPIKLVELAVK